jgi:hypothetical protein
MTVAASASALTVAADAFLGPGTGDGRDYLGPWCLMDNVDRLLDVFRKGKFAVTVGDTTLAHAFLPPGTRNPTLQVSSPGEIPRYHLRLFEDHGELVFLVADQEAPKGTPERHPWAVRVPIADSIRALERDLGEAALEGFKSRLGESVYPANIDGMKGVWVLVGMFDADLPLDHASFDGDTTRIDEPRWDRHSGRYGSCPGRRSARWITKSA